MGRHSERIRPDEMFLRSRAKKAVDIADQADEVGKPDVRDKAEDILGQVVKMTLRGRLPDEVLERIGKVQINEKEPITNNE